MMDAPLLLTPIVNPHEVDDQVWSFDLCNGYPLEFYHKTLEGVPPKHVLNLLDVVYTRLGKPEQYEGYGFIHDVADINLGVRENMYKKLETMMDKLQSQMFLMEKIDGVDVRNVARRVLGVHFMRDIAGNLRVFASQSFRCKRCNHHYRRIPLRGRCERCGGQISLTVYKGSVEKYLDVARWLTETYNLEEYHKQRIELISDDIASTFPENGTGKQRKEADLTEFM
jgi:DNA polymerase II large subunit